MRRCWGPRDGSPVRSHRERHLDSQASILRILSSSRGPAWEQSSRAWESRRPRELPRSPSACFLGCLHSGQATMCQGGPQASSGCWRSGRSRTSLTSDSGRGCSHRSPCWAAPIPCPGGAGLSLAGLDSPSPVWGGPGLGTGRAPGCSGGGQMESGWRPWGREGLRLGVRLASVAFPLCQCWEII